MLVACLALLFAGAMSPGRADDDGNEPLARVQALIRGGATQLALRLIDQYQPPVAQAEAWIAWEKQRYALYRAQHDWARLAARVADLPPGLPAEFTRWARTEAVQARLNAADAEGARRLLRELLWSGEGGESEQAEWRQLVIRSYLVEDDVEDARAAVARYRADFSANTPAWRELEARILIRDGRAKQAYARLGGLMTYEGRLLSLLAALRGGVLPPATVLARSLALAEETRSKPAVNHEAWVLAAEAAARAGNAERRIYALERALTDARDHPSTDRLLTVNADQLWAAYDRYAESAGNDARLLVGNDAAWLKKATAYKRDDAMQARAFYAFLLTHGASDDSRKLAARRLADSLIEDGRAEVLRALFAASHRYPQLTDVPAYVRYRLADVALDGYDIEFAARVMQGLEQAPAGEDPEMWTLRRARVLIYAGDYRQAFGLLSNLLDSRKSVDDVFADRLLQVIFDLQAAGQHTPAIALLDTLGARAESVRERREILYWIADSKAALGRYQEAAELYLRSATYQNPTGGDMWGQTARYHAAEALAKAGLTRDARLVYERLLRHTDDPKQRAVIERNIQQLWLIEKQATTP